MSRGSSIYSLYSIWLLITQANLDNVDICCVTALPNRYSLPSESLSGNKHLFQNKPVCVFPWHNEAYYRCDYVLEITATDSWGQERMHARILCVQHCMCGPNAVVAGTAVLVMWNSLIGPLCKKWSKQNTIWNMEHFHVKCRPSMAMYQSDQQELIEFLLH